jgi:hypothetical protein
VARRGHVRRAPSQKDADTIAIVERDAWNDDGTEMLQGSRRYALTPE